MVVVGKIWHNIGYFSILSLSFPLHSCASFCKYLFWYSCYIDTWFSRSTFGLSLICVTQASMYRLCAVVLWEFICMFCEYWQTTYVTNSELDVALTLMTHKWDSLIHTHLKAHMSMAWQEQPPELQDMELVWENIELQCDFIFSYMSFLCFKSHVN